MSTAIAPRRRRSALLSALVIGILAMVVTGCASGPSADEPTTTTPAAEAADAIGIVGVWGDPDAERTPSIVFAEDGSLSGTDGCNRLVGSWTADGDTVEFGPLASTRMACEGVDTWLSGGVSGTWTHTSLVIRDGDGAQIGTLERSE